MALAPVAVSAQPSSDSPFAPSAEAKIYLGPLALGPRISLTNVGVDTNVFNDSANPRRDFTATFVPGLDSWLRLGRVQLAGKTSVELVYFRDSPTQRSANFGQESRLDVMLANATPYISGGYVTSSQRPNTEIDARVRRTTKTAAAGSELHLGGRTLAVVEGAWSRLALDDVDFGGVSLARQLDREVSLVKATLKVALTPLTSFVVRNELQHDRFTFEPGRNANSVIVMPGFEFKPLALLSGKALVGYRRFSPRGAGVPEFAGIISAVDLTYVARDATRVVGKVDRDVDYSFEPEQPYFVTTGGSLSVTQMLFGNCDGVVRVGRRRLDYRRLAGSNTGVAGVERRDSVSSYGAGLGYHLAVDVRVGFDVDYMQRRSVDVNRRYEGYRFGGSFTYGF